MRFSIAGLKVETRRTAGLTDKEWAGIWAFAARFTDATREGFEQSARHKRDVIEIRDSDGQLVGLGAVDVDVVEHEGQRRVVIFPGDTLFDEGIRGNDVVQRIGALYYLAARARYPRTPVYMVYGTFSYKTYLMLPRNFRTFWPRHGVKTPEPERRFLAAMAERYYGNMRHSPAGDVIGRASKRLKLGVATVDETALADPDVRYFYEQNPDYDQGDTLLCLIPLDLRNWITVAKNFARRSARRRRKKG